VYNSSCTLSVLLTSALGTFLTFAQFLYVAIQTFSTQLYYPPGAWLPRWRANKVPMARWAVQVILFFGVNISELSQCI
jgi:UDP-xylose/UDP-N-acetylglucosamine transporter B4